MQRIIGFKPAGWHDLHTENALPEPLLCMVVLSDILGRDVARRNLRVMLCIRSTKPAVVKGWRKFWINYSNGNLTWGNGRSDGATADFDDMFPALEDNMFPALEDGIRELLAAKFRKRNAIHKSMCCPVWGRIEVLK